jgi:peptide-methionine (S)-S-oxide reductase
MLSFLKSRNDPPASATLPDRNEAIAVSDRHYVNGNPIVGPFAENLETAVFALGCFWGAERKFWKLDGVFTTAAGYAGGSTRNASYQDVCSGHTGHAEVVMVVFDPEKIGYADLLNVFWESHDPTQGMRQGNDFGSQYRSAIYTSNDEQDALARESCRAYGEKLDAAGYPAITTEITPVAEFFYAEDYHQQYLAKNSGGYCGLGGTGVTCS